MFRLKTILIPTFLTIVFIGFASADKPKLVKTRITPEITVSIPRDWIPMTEQDFTQRYPSVRAPLAAFTSVQRSADVSVNISATQWPDGDPAIAQKFFKASIMNMFDKVDIIDEGVREIQGKKFVYFEFESRVNGNKGQSSLKDPVLKYTYLMYLLAPRKTTVFSFSCMKFEREEWQETAHAIMKSVRVK